MMNEKDPSQSGPDGGWKFAAELKQMAEQQPGSEAYSFEGRLPSGARERGFRIEHDFEAPHQMPVREVFPHGQDQWGDYEALATVTQRAAKEGEFTDSDVGLDNRKLLGQVFKAMSPHNVEADTYTSKVSEAFEFTSWGHSVRLYNFFGQRLDDVQLSQITNALRAVGETSGGKVFEQLTQIAIVPDGHPSLLKDKEIWRYSRQNKPVTYNGVAADFADADGEKHSLIILNFRLLSKRAIADPPDSAPIDADALPFHPHPGELEDTMAHELFHVLGDSNPNAEDEYSPTELGPSKYAATNHKEDLAETGSALHAGGGWQELVGPEHQELFQATMAKIHSGVEGPTYVGCKEIDLRSITAGDTGGIEEPSAA